jgi:hypothetical protein
VRLEALGKLKYPLTSSGIEPTTCWLASYLKETGHESVHWIHLPQECSLIGADIMIMNIHIE